MRRYSRIEVQSISNNTACNMPNMRNGGLKCICSLRHIGSCIYFLSRSRRPLSEYHSSIEGARIDYLTSTATIFFHHLGSVGRWQIVSQQLARTVRWARRKVPLNYGLNSICQYRVTEILKERSPALLRLHRKG